MSASLHLNKTVIVGLSGGVDSAVAAYLLKKEGYRVVGLFMKNWDESDNAHYCSAEEDYQDVVKVCKKLGIPHYSVNFVKQYWDEVFTDFLAGYEQGFTPNPDILCNREIKFKHFFNKAMELGADYLATGHYAQILPSCGSLALFKAKDLSKDQSYFLYTLKSTLLPKILFPLGNLLKSQVREIAKNIGLDVHSKKDSTGICFIGERKFTPFLKNYLKEKPGNFCTLDGNKVGKHIGAVYYTIGQRKGLQLGGEGPPWYVVDKNMDKNIVYVERGEHPALFTHTLVAKNLSWVRENFLPSPGFTCTAKVRYRQEDQACHFDSVDNYNLTVSFTEAQRAIAPLQSVVFYSGQECLGGGFIDKKGPSLYEQEKDPP